MLQNTLVLGYIDLFLLNYFFFPQKGLEYRGKIIKYRSLP